MTATAVAQYLRKFDPRQWQKGMLDVVLAVSALLVISYGFTEPAFRIAGQLAILAFLIQPSLIRNPVIWLGLALALFAATAWLFQSMGL